MRAFRFLLAKLFLVVVVVVVVPPLPLAPVELSAVVVAALRRKMLSSLYINSAHVLPGPHETYPYDIIHNMVQRSQVTKTGYTWAFQSVSR